MGCNRLQSIAVDCNALQSIAIDWIAIDWIAIDWIAIDWILIDWIAVDWIVGVHVHAVVVVGNKDTGDLWVSYDFLRPIVLKSFADPRVSSECLETDRFEKLRRTSLTL